MDHYIQDTLIRNRPNSRQQVYQCQSLAQQHRTPNPTIVSAVLAMTCGKEKRVVTKDLK